MTVSAIVSAYYAKDFIRARLDNLMYQVPRPEIVVVAQHSSIEAAIAKTYPVTLIQTADIPTIYAAWNMAIKESTGEYIANANCDDHIYSGSYAEMAKVLNDNPDIGLVYGDENQTDGKTNRLKQRPQGDFSLLTKMCFVGPMPMWRKSLHDHFGYFNESFKVCGDYEFWLRLAVNGVKFHHIPRALGLYLNRPNSAEHRQKLVATAEKEYLQRIYSGIKVMQNM
jgi:glycosyltransferase involved in cell wall biosynthesis